MFLLALPLLAAAPNAGAQQYVGISVGTVDTGEFTTTAPIARYGIKLSEFFSGEVRYGQGLVDDVDTHLFIEFRQEINRLYGLYGRYGLPLDDAISWYVVLGYSFVEESISVSPRNSDLIPPEENPTPTISASDDFSSASYGFGTDWHLNREWTLNFEYTGYVRQRNLYIDGLSLGIVRQFR